jgi:hypothetical protein
MAKTSVGGDDERPKKFSDKIKKSPAAKDYREKGAKHVAKKLGQMAGDIGASAASKVSYNLGLTDNPPSTHPVRNRGTSNPRAHHFVSSYDSSRGEVHGECATCNIQDFNR